MLSGRLESHERNLMNELEHELEDFTFLGWYSEA